MTLCENGWLKSRLWLAVEMTGDDWMDVALVVMKIHLVEIKSVAEELGEGLKPPKLT